MSRETREWLANNTLIGFTDKRGGKRAWHYRDGDTNHYGGAVPIEDVRKRLFDWTPEERPIYVGGGARQGDGGVAPGMYPVPGRKAIVRSDNGAVLGVFSDGYQPHHYDEWLLSNVEAILSQSLMIGSAGLLENGAVAWVQVEMPENVTTAEGVTFRPWINAFSSLNGKFATTYKTGVTNIVCDNTMRAAQGERSEQFKAKSTSKSLERLGQVRDALGLVFSTGEDFAAEVAQLCATDFTNRQFDALVKDMFPIEDDAPSRTRTMTTQKRDQLHTLWVADERVAPWSGTAWGAYQAFNTYGQHVARIKGDNRAERNMTKTLNGKIDEADDLVLTRITALA